MLVLNNGSNIHKALLYEKYSSAKFENGVRCRLCSHYCIVKPNEYGKCLTRINLGGEFFDLTYGLAEGIALDPIEKKPFYHFKPGTFTLSFGTPGCNFSCLNCQNWSMSQAFRVLKEREAKNRLFSPDDIINLAIKSNADGVSYTYSEPTIFFEYARDVIHKCKQTEGCEKMYHAFVSNGYFSKELLDLIETESLLDAINIDLKFIRNDKYRKICGASAKPVIESIKRLNRNSSIHIEIINLVIPDENDNDDDLKKLSETIADISLEIPLHFSRFYPQFKMLDKPQTSLETLIKAKETARSYGIKYIYIGNTRLDDVMNTYCPACNNLLISRSGIGVKKIFLDKSSKGNKAICPFCKTDISLIL